MQEGYYSIEGFNSARGLGRDGYGLTITLAAKAVEAILLLEERRDETNPFYTDLVERIRRTVPGPDASYARLDFYEDTWLLVGMRVGSDCACFGVGGGRREQLLRGDAILLRYDSHNVDTPEQAAAIVSTWLEWFNTVASLAGLRQPHAL